MFRVQFTAGIAPTITTQPANQTVMVGEPASFTVGASGTPTLAYQWQRNMVNIGGANNPAFTISATALSDTGAKFRCVVTNSFGTATSNEATLTVNAPPPIVITEQNTDVAVALDSVWMMRDPFPLTNLFNFSVDDRTRLMLFVRNLELLPSENSSAVTARAENVQMSPFPMTVEHVSKLGGFDFSEVVVRLPDNLPTGQSLLIGLTLRGQTSNKARITMR